MRPLLSPNATVLLFCRRQPSRPFRLCGRLRAVAVAAPLKTDEPPATHASGLPVWPVAAPSPDTPPPAPHVLFELQDVDGLPSDDFACVFGAKGIGAVRPEEYLG